MWGRPVAVPYQSFWRSELEIGGNNFGFGLL